MFELVSNFSKFKTMFNIAFLNTENFKVLPARHPNSRKKNYFGGFYLLRNLKCQPDDYGSLTLLKMKLVFVFSRFLFCFYKRYDKNYYRFRNVKDARPSGLRFPGVFLVKTPFLSH